MQKNTIKTILFSTVIFLMFLPLLATLSSFMTHSLDNSGWYEPIEKHLVPFESKLVRTVLGFVGIDTRTSYDLSRYQFFMLKGDEAIEVDLAWNCLGWQSMLIFVISIVAGLRKKFSNISRLESIMFGFFGTLLINIFRMSTIAAGSYYLSNIFVLIIHDYLAVVISTMWLMFFWWFSYRYVLEEKVNLTE